MYKMYIFLTEKIGSIYWQHFPLNQTSKIHDNITLKCEGQSSEPLQYQW